MLTRTRSGAGSGSVSSLHRCDLPDDEALGVAEPTQLKARLLGQPDRLSERFAVPPVWHNTLWIGDDRVRACERRIERHRLDPEVVEDDFDVDAAAASAGGGGAQRRKSRPTRRLGCRGWDSVSPEDELGEPMICTERRAHSAGELLLWIGACRRGDRRSRRRFVTTAAAGCDGGKYDTTELRDGSHAANPACSS